MLCHSMVLWRRNLENRIMTQLLGLRLLAAFLILMGIGLWAYARSPARTDLTSAYIKYVSVVELFLGLFLAYFVFF